MLKTNIEKAHSVLLPAFDSTALSDEVKQFLDKGGCSILLGESRSEYVARTMSAKRIAEESPSTFHQVIRQARGLTDHLLVAVDQEIGGICRLHRLVPAFPPKELLNNYKTVDFEQLSLSIAKSAKDLGVNCFLAPILDLLTGENPWLQGRTWSTDPNQVAQLSSAFIRGIQKGGVAATAKHFPGFHHIPLDPAIKSEAIVSSKEKAFEDGFIPFKAAIKNEVEMIMVGPAIVEAFDKQNPASLSSKVMGILRNELNFKGVIMSDDLDAKATLKNKSIESVAIASLNAGADFLLLAAMDNQLERVTKAICKAVENGDLKAERLADAAAKVQALAQKYN